jgi:hypothetical protein
VFETPHKVQEFQDVLATLEATVTPTTRRGVVKLGRGAVQAVATANLLSGEVRNIRKLRQVEEQSKKRKRFQMQEDKRSLNVQKVVRQRAKIECAEWRTTHRIQGRSLILHLTIKKPNLEMI